MKTILLPINDDDGAEARLQAALDVAHAHGSHIACLQVTPSAAYITTSESGVIHVLANLPAAVRSARARLRADVEARLAREDVPWSFEHCDGDPALTIIARAALADLIVLTRCLDRRHPNDPLPLAGDVVIHARTPVLAVQPAPVGFDACGRALVAWNGSLEAANALKAGLPMLRRASAIEVITVIEDDAVMRFPATEACEYLARHGLESELHEVARNDRTVGEGLLGAVDRIGADYVVMGAYGHSRIREFLLGGVTREMLAACPVPLLLAH